MIITAVKLSRKIYSSFHIKIGLIGNIRLLYVSNIMIFKTTTLIYHVYQKTESLSDRRTNTNPTGSGSQQRIGNFHYFCDTSSRKICQKKF